MHGASRSAALRAVSALGLVAFTAALAVVADRAAHRFASHLSPAVVSKVGPLGVGIVLAVTLVALWPVIGALRISLAASRSASREARPVGEQRVYTVSDGDTLWSIAAVTLGAPRQWIRIAALNAGARQVDGSVFDPAFLRPGWRLVVPPEGDRVRPVHLPQPAPTNAHEALGSLGAWRPDAVIRPLRPPPPPAGSEAPHADAVGSAILAEPVSQPEPVSSPGVGDLVAIDEVILDADSKEAAQDSGWPSAPEVSEIDEAVRSEETATPGPEDVTERPGMTALQDGDETDGESSTASDETDLLTEKPVIIADEIHDALPSAPNAAENVVYGDEFEELSVTAGGQSDTAEPLLDAMAVLTERITGAPPSSDTEAVLLGPADAPEELDTASEGPSALSEAETNAITTATVLDGEPAHESEVDERLVERLVEICHSAEAERLALALRVAAQTMTQQSRTPVAARIGTRAVEVWFDASRPVTAGELAPAPWAAWPGMAGWVLTEDVDLSPYAPESTIPSPTPALVPVGFDREGLVLVNAGVFKTVSFAAAQAPEYGQAIRTILSSRTRAPWTDGACLSGETTGAAGDVVVEVRKPDEPADPVATASVVLGPLSDAALTVETDGRIPALGTLVVTPETYEPARAVTKSAVLRVLGPIGVSGAGVGAFPLVPAQLVAFVALGGGRATTARALDAIFDHRRVSRSQAWRVRKQAAEALGTASDGKPRLREAERRDLVLADVDCDWDAFLRLVDADPAGALDLVSGEPLEGVESEWALPWRVDMGQRIASCALKVAQAYLVDGDVSASRITARRGLRAAPYDENLWILLLDVAASAGRGALGEQWEEIVATLGEGRESGVAPTLRAAYQRIRSAVAV
jgi:hypothetical protein